jgi:hypothetical protein
MFKIGDDVQYKTPGSALTGAKGRIVAFDPYYYSYEVDFVNIGIIACMGEDLEFSTQVELPTGISNDNWAGAELRTKECDCGGYKTFGSMEPAMHSAWCTSVAKKIL